MFLQMFQSIVLLGCIFLGSTHTSNTQGGEKSDPWKSSPTHLIASSYDQYNGDLSASNNTKSYFPSSQSIPSYKLTSTTTEQPRTGIEAPPVKSYATITPSQPFFTTESGSKSLISSKSVATLSPTVSTSWQFVDSPTKSYLPGVDPSLRDNVDSPTPFLNIKTTLSKQKVKKESSTSSPIQYLTTKSIFSPIAGTIRPTGRQKWRTSSSSLVAPPPRTTPLTVQVDQDEYYSAYPDYSESLTSQINSTGKLEAVLLPEPENENGRSSWDRKQPAPSSKSQRLPPEQQYKVRLQERRSSWSERLVERRTEEESIALDQDILAQTRTDPNRRLAIELPDDSLADTDLHDHDLIDSVMYIYFGASPSDQRAPGRQVVVVGCVVGLLAQFLTLAGGVRRMKSKPDSSLSVLLHTELALTLTNLVFILGVQARGSHCEAVAVSLHYLHLVVCSWLSASCLHSYRRIVHPTRSNPLLLYAAVSWGLPTIPTLLCYWLEREAYETRDYCWMSVERGMMLSFLLPTSLLILVNTVLALAGLKQAKQDDPERRSLRISASLLPMFSVIWFLGVVALEHSSSLVLPLLFVATSGFLNWFVLICWLPSEAGGWKATDDDLDDEEDDLYEQEVKVVMDEQPLLQEVCLTRPPYHTLHMEPISTISS